MQYRDAIRWLDAIGGQWCVRATAAAALVIVTTRTLSVRVPSTSLDVEQVGRAVVTAVETLKELGDQPVS